MRTGCTIATSLFISCTVLWAGCYDTPENAASVRLAVDEDSAYAVSDSFWVDVQLKGAEGLASDVVSIHFIFHYTNGHLRVLQHEGGDGIRPGSYRANHYPSHAEVEIGAALDSIRQRASGQSLTLARIRLLAEDVTTDDAPAYLSFSNITAYDADGARQGLDGDPTRMTIRSAGGGASTVPELQLFTQHAVQNRLQVKRVTLDQSGWIAIRRAEAGLDTPPVATQWLEAGTHEEIEIPLDGRLNLAEEGLARLRAVLHSDTGTPEQFEYEGPDTPDPPIRRGEKEVGTTFYAQYTASTPESYIDVENQQLTGDYIHINEVIASEPANVVIHRGLKGRPFLPDIIGKVRVEAGSNRDVRVPFFEEETVVCGETLWPMLHVRSVSDDQPYEIDEPIITAPATMLCE